MISRQVKISETKEGAMGRLGGSTITTTYGFKPWGLRGFCLGSVGSYGTFAGGGVGVGDQRAVT
jgi:hypothetical protein